LEEINFKFQNLHIADNMAENRTVSKKKINKPPVFSGIRNELKGFLTVVDLNFENDPDLFADDRAKIRYIISFLSGDPLIWAANLRKLVVHSLITWKNLKRSSKLIMAIQKWMLS